MPRTPGLPRLGRPPSTTSADTKRRILDTARAAFASRGYEASTNRTLGAEAGITAGARYHYFGSKFDLYLAVNQDVQERVYRKIQRRGGGDLAPGRRSERRHVRDGGPAGGRSARRGRRRCRSAGRHADGARALPRGGMLERYEVRRLSTQLLIDGHETTVGLISFVLYRLIGRPDLVAQLREDRALRWGAHHCIGAPLARREGQLALRLIVDRFETVELTGEVTRNAPFVLRALTSLPTWRVAS